MTPNMNEGYQSGTKAVWKKRKNQNLTTTPFPEKFFERLQHYKAFFKKCPKSNLKLFFIAKPDATRMAEQPKKSFRYNQLVLIQ